jgi:uncharacterized membrane protein
MASSKARSRNRPASGKGRRAASARAAAPGVQTTPTSRGKPANGVKPSGRVRAAEPDDSAAPPAAEAAEAARPAGPPLWLQLTTLALALLGLALSAYETYAHYTGNHLAGCPAGKGSTFDCTAVITSSQSMVFGVIPVAILGLIFYVFVVAIMTPWAWRTERREVHWLRLASMITGMGFVMYLIYAELYQIGQVCEYCSGVHIITFVLFCITLVCAAIWGLGKPKTTS